MYNNDIRNYKDIHMLWITLETIPCKVKSNKMFLKFYFISSRIMESREIINYIKKDPLIKTRKFCKQQKDPLIDSWHT